MSVKLLEGTVKQVKEDYPHLVVGNTVVARKMGFPEVIMPCKSRAGSIIREPFPNRIVFLCLVQSSLENESVC